jgi:hypothetical protein
MDPSSPLGIQKPKPGLNESRPYLILELTNPVIYHNNIVINIVDMINSISSTRSRINHMVQINFESPKIKDQNTRDDHHLPMPIKGSSHP